MGYCGDYRVFRGSRQKAIPVAKSLKLGNIDVYELVTFLLFLGGFHGKAIFYSSSCRYTVFST